MVVQAVRRATTGRVLMEAALVVVAFGLIAVLVTWPLAGNFDSRMLGPGGGDQLGYLFDFQNFANTGLPLVHDYVQENVYAPFGRPASALANLTLSAQLAPATLLTKAFGPIVAYNTLTLAGLALSGISMYGAVRWLGLGIGPASWAGLVYTLFPFHLHAAASYVTLTPYWFFPPLIIALVAWTVQAKRSSGALIVLLVGIAFITFVYFGVMALVMGGVAVAIALYRHTVRDGLRRSVTATGLLVGSFVAAVVIPLGAIFFINRGGTTGTLERNPQEMRDLSARLSDYVVPPRTDHLLTGIVGPEWYGHGSVGGERLAFLGWVTIALCLCGVALGWYHRKSLSPRLRAAVLICPPMLAALVLCSLTSPYPVGGIDLQLPSGVIFEAFPYMRAFGRFVIAVVAVAAVLGAIGIRLLADRREQVGRIAVVAAALVFTTAELADGAPLTSTVPTIIEGKNLDGQAHWRWLKNQDDGEIVYEYPDFGNSSIERYYMHGHLVHGHPVMNAVGSPGDVGGAFLGQVVDIWARDAAKLLATARVRYVTLNPWAFRAFQVEMPTATPEGMEVAATFPDGAKVLRVVGPPAEGVVTFGEGFGVGRVEKGENHRWLTGAGRVTTHLASPGTYRAVFRVRPGLSPVGTLTITSPDGFRDSVRVERENEEVRLTVHLTAESNVLSVGASRAATPDRPFAVDMTPWLLYRAP